MAYTWSPTAAQIAEVIPNRAQDASRSFTDTTNPSLAIVEAHIATICDEVAATAGDPDALTIEASDTVKNTALTTLKGVATRCAIFGAAHAIELGYTSGATNDHLGKPQQLWTAYQQQLKNLRKAIGEFNQGQKMGGVNDLQAPSGSFPVQSPHYSLPGYVLNASGDWVPEGNTW